MSVFLDTNVLLRRTQHTHLKLYTVAVESVAHVDTGELVYLTRQNISESGVSLPGP